MTTTAEVPATLKEDAELFIGSTCHVFEVMLRCETVHGKLILGDIELGKGVHTTAVIGLKGSNSWVATASFGKSAAREITKQLLGMPDSVSDAEISDAMGELMNMIGGGAKAPLAERQGEPIALGLPTVVCGGDYQVWRPADSKTVTVPFKSKFGNFIIAVTVSSK